MKKINRDLDIVNLLEMVRDQRVLLKCVFDQKEQFFLKNQRRDMIHSSSTSNSEAKR